MDRHNNVEHMSDLRQDPTGSAATTTTPHRAFMPTHPHHQAKAADAFTSLVDHVVQQEWDQFQDVHNEGGRAACQGNWPVFHQMRASQFLTWSMPLLQSYSDDLNYAEESGRNLLSEKYGRMMVSTAPEQFAESIAPYLATLSADRIAQQERIIATQIAWVIEFRHAYPKLGQAMRLIHTSEDSQYATSFETYLRGELSTYSARTLDYYEALIASCKRNNLNLTQETVEKTVQLGGYKDLEEAEASQ
ncbi:hypothetical protein BAQU_1345 [Bifidobacterium aquikefiri]|uniref:DUF4125 domain-containing protein n=2 Tax=Bifidobacterium aquikefiri TaxID=1653207 RepID=A0A261G778_9BIFI|nr:hypothetical protein BAQU_1345 [Bifidobacterium aquikefiri]